MPSVTPSEVSARHRAFTSVDRKTSKVGWPPVHSRVTSSGPDPCFTISTISGGGLWATDGNDRKETIRSATATDRFLRVPFRGCTCPRDCEMIAPGLDFQAPGTVAV